MTYLNIITVDWYQVFKRESFYWTELPAVSLNCHEHLSGCDKVRVNAGEPESAIEIRGCRCFQWNSHSVLWLWHQSGVSGWEGIHFVTMNIFVNCLLNDKASRDANNTMNKFSVCSRTAVKKTFIL